MDVESRDLFNSINQALEKRIESARIRLEEKQDKLKNPREKIGKLDKMFIKSDIKSYQKQIRKLTELSKSFANLRFNDADKYILPKDLKSYFDKLGTLLTENEVKVLRDNVNLCLRNTNKVPEKKVKQEVSEIKKLLNNLNIGDRKFLIYNSFEYVESISFNGAVKKLETIKLKNLTPKYIFIKNNFLDTTFELNDDLLLSSLEEMIKSNKLEKNKSVQSIKDNFSLIKKAFYSKTKLEKTLFVLSKTLSELRRVTEVDFSKVITYLKQLENNYRKELDKTNKFLDKFDFTDVKKQIEEIKQQEEKERSENFEISEYQHLAYELEKVMTENPNDYEKIQQLKENMKHFAMNSKLTTGQLEVAMADGKSNYEKEKEEQQARANNIKEKIAYEEQLRKDVMRQIREYAIHELERAGAFEESYEYRNGDVYSTHIDKEALIKNKIEELKRLADLTPEERGLEDQKRRGFVSQDTRLEDLTPSKLNELRIAYSDSSYEFMTDYKDFLSREKIKPQANNIYKEYIKYRITLKDKNEFLSFSEYAKQFHNIDNMSDIMVDEELKEEMKGASR